MQRTFYFSEHTVRELGDLNVYLDCESFFLFPPPPPPPPARTMNLMTILILPLHTFLLLFPFFTKQLWLFTSESLLYSKITSQAYSWRDCEEVTMVLQTYLKRVSSFVTTGTFLQSEVFLEMVNTLGVYRDGAMAENDVNWFCYLFIKWQLLLFRKCAITSISLAAILPCIRSLVCTHNINSNYCYCPSVKKMYSLSLSLKSQAYTIAYGSS